MIIDVSKQWHEYRDACFRGRPLGIVQETELRRAFFAGMLISLNLLNELSAEPETLAVVNLEALRNQVIGQLASFLAVQS